MNNDPPENTATDRTRDLGFEIDTPVEADEPTAVIDDEPVMIELDEDPEMTLSDVTEAGADDHPRRALPRWWLYAAVAFVVAACGVSIWYFCLKPPPAAPLPPPDPYTTATQDVPGAAPEAVPDPVPVAGLPDDHALARALAPF